MNFACKQLCQQSAAGLLPLILMIGLLPPGLAQENGARLPEPTESREEFFQRQPSGMGGDMGEGMGRRGGGMRGRMGERMGRRGGMGGGMGGRGGGLGQMMQQGGQLDLRPLNLTEDQKQKIQTMREQNREQARALRKQLLPKMQAVKKLMFSAEATDAQVHAASLETRKLQQKLDEVNINGVLAIRKMLTADQRAKWPEVAPQGPGRGMGEDGGRMGGGGRMRGQGLRPRGQGFGGGGPGADGPGPGGMPDEGP